MSVAYRISCIFALFFLIALVSGCATKDGVSGQGSCMKASCGAKADSCSKSCSGKSKSADWDKTDSKCCSNCQGGCPYKSNQGKSSCGKGNNMGGSCGSAAKDGKKAGCGQTGSQEAI